MKSVFWGYGEIPIKRQAEDFAILRLLSFGSKRPCLLRFSYTFVYPLAFILIFGYNVSCIIVLTGDFSMKGYMSAREASYKWGVSESRVHKLCQQGRILGLERFGRSWVIPANAVKPADPRIRNGSASKTEKCK